MCRRWGLIIQGIWAAFLVLPRTVWRPYAAPVVDVTGNTEISTAMLLDYVMFRRAHLLYPDDCGIVPAAKNTT